MGTSLTLQRKCAACEKDETLAVQLKGSPGEAARSTASAASDLGAAARAAQRGGEPLPDAVRALLEPSFGFDFSNVRVHVDAGAAEAVAARAYTIGRDIVFGAGEYAPGTSEGRRLLAHELAHVVQQQVSQGSVSRGVSAAGDASEREADVAADAVMSGERVAAFNHSSVAGLQRQTRLDAAAQAFVTLAQNQSIPIDERGQQLVTQMLAAYYPSEGTMFSAIRYVATEPGVKAVCAQSGPANMTCTMDVGEYFVTNTTSAGISRRVLQLGHEIQHVIQHRQGMGGGARRHEREFLAFHWEATTAEKAGTGHMAHATRVSLIDAAIGNYNCFTAAEKATHDTRYRQLLTLRQTEQSASGNAATAVPTECRG